ncbi:MAG: MurR/RpiR family transcriptional regulator, partial [Pseudomonadota bacterium]
KRGAVSFPDRVRWLQDIRKTGDLGGLYADMISATLRNVEDTFARINGPQLEQAAEMIWAAQSVYTLGVGANNSVAQNFNYLASTGMVNFHAIPRPGSVPADDLAWATENDVLIAITSKPYRTEVVKTVDIAREQGVRIVGISDSPASPIILGADFGFVVGTDTPQFFPSSVATIALLETLLSMVIAVADPRIIQRVEKFHQRRHDLGMYIGDAE